MAGRTDGRSSGLAPAANGAVLSAIARGVGVESATRPRCPGGWPQPCAPAAGSAGQFRDTLAAGTGARLWSACHTLIGNGHQPGRPDVRGGREYPIDPRPCPRHAGPPDDAGRIAGGFPPRTELVERPAPRCGTGPRRRDRDGRGRICQAPGGLPWPLKLTPRPDPCSSRLRPLRQAVDRRCRCGRAPARLPGRPKRQCGDAIAWSYECGGAGTRHCSGRDCVFSVGCTMERPEAVLRGRRPSDGPRRTA